MRHDKRNYPHNEDDFRKNSLVHLEEEETTAIDFKKGLKKFLTGKDVHEITSDDLNDRTEEKIDANKVLGL